MEHFKHLSFLNRIRTPAANSLNDQYWHVQPTWGMVVINIIILQSDLVRRSVFHSFLVPSVL